MPDANGFEAQWQEIRRIWAEKENHWLYSIIGFLVGLLASSFLVSTSDTLATLFLEAVGIAFTILIIDRLNESRARRQLKAQLTANGEY